MKLPARYEAAHRALEAATRVDEVKSIRDKAMAMEVYAYQSKDAHLARNSVKLKRRAVRRLGELMAEMRIAGKLNKGTRGQLAGQKKGGRPGGVKKPPPGAPTLDAQGVDKDLAKAARAAASTPADEYEQETAKACEIASAHALNNQAVIKQARAAAIAEKLANRRRKHRAIRAAATTPTISRRFPLLYADPPWFFKTYTELGGGRAPDNHYPTMADDDIVSLAINGRPMREVAHADAALFLWCTSSNLPLALRVMDAWGFGFKASAVWVKDKQGTGQIFRNWHEVLLYGSRGKMPGPVYLPPSVFRYPRGVHSAKPPEVRAEIEKMYPDYGEHERLELFARGPVPGWSTYGFETSAVAKQPDSALPELGLAVG